jgi:hypothetical protein
MTRLWLLLAIAWTAMSGPPTIRDVDGQVRAPFAPARHATVLLFISSDCPISNNYAPEIAAICGRYAARGIDCLLLYEDARINSAAARDHRKAFSLGDLPAAIDADRTIAGAAGATITPEAAVIDRQGTVRYRGRIDDVYLALGRRRHAPTTRDLRDAVDAVLSDRGVTRPRTEATGCYIAPPWKDGKDRE